MNWEQIAMQIIHIKGKMPSLNEYIKWCRGNRYGASSKVKAIEQSIMIQLGKLKPISKPITIHFQWHEKDRRRDKDNVAFAKKFLLDALQYANILPNDNNRYIMGFSDGFDYGNKENGVTMYISEAEEKD